MLNKLEAKVNPQKVFIIIPVYNEASKVKEVVRSIQKDYKYKIVTVEDGSRDDSYKILKEIPNIFVLRHLINRGQGAAIRTGQEFALTQGAEYIVHFDSDGQHSKNDIPEMLEALITNNADVALGSRFLSDEKKTNASTVKKIILKLGILFTWTTSGLNLTDTHNGFRVMNRKAAQTLLFTMDRYQHASEVFDILKGSNLKYIEHPVHINYTAYSLQRGQKISNSINIAFSLLISKIIDIFIK